MRSMNLAFGAAIVAFVLWAIGKRRSGKRILPLLGFGSKKVTFSSSSNARHTRDNAIEGLYTVCKQLEDALASATKGGDLDRERRLRRVLCRVYGALEVSEVSDEDNFSPRRDQLLAPQFHLNEQFGIHTSIYRQTMEDDDECSSVTSFQSAFTSLEQDEEDAEIALEAAMTEITVLNGDKPTLYDLVFLNREGVEFRKNRTVQTGCANTEDFMTRLKIVRDASATMLADVEFRTWFIDFGCDLLCGLLREGTGGKDVEEFKTRFLETMEWLERMSNEDRLGEVLEEFAPRGVKFLSVFDIALDIILLDAFDDLETLPSTVTSVLQNQWIPNSIKETTLTTAIRSVIASKEAKSQPDGAFKRIYSMFKLLSPSLACGLLGCTSNPTFNALCKDFAGFINSSVKEWFQFEKNGYTDIDHLANDMKLLWRGKAEDAFELLERHSSS
eukprot:m.22829 g.22829  ORF g.22829 m.22829 type:complete len:444 (-) comp5483_c0_seq1:76-1407(-)